MTLLVASIEPHSLSDLERLAADAWQRGANAVEVRLDRCAGSSTQIAGYLASHDGRTWIATCRSRAEGGHSEGDLDQRLDRLCEITRRTNAYTDFELADWDRHERARSRLRDALADQSSQRLILSAHDFANPPTAAPSPGGTDLPIGRLTGSIERALADPHTAAVKIAYIAHDIADTFAALDLMREYGHRIITVAMGEEGLWTRLLARKLGAFATYAALGPGTATAPGQLTIDEMIHRYRWPAINSDTAVYGLIGDPVVHSVGPILHNRWFDQSSTNAVYLPLRVAGDDAALTHFLDQCRQRPWLHAGGFSVTVPHKERALQWAGDTAEHLARGVGAANTLAFNRGHIQAYNTDAYAAVMSLLRALGTDHTGLLHRSVDLLGTGGAARALAYSLTMLGARVTVYGRSPEKANALAAAFDATAAPWDKRSNRTGEIVINATSVGMWPRADESPLPDNAFDGCRLAFDIIYNPLETKFLHDARRAGARTRNGLDMFVRQAAMQFAIWTGAWPAATEATTRELENHMRRTGPNLP